MSLSDVQPMTASVSWSRMDCARLWRSESVYSGDIILCFYTTLLLLHEERETSSRSESIEGAGRVRRVCKADRRRCATVSAKTGRPDIYSARAEK